jgi:hypothetical protein
MKNILLIISLLVTLNVSAQDKSEVDFEKRKEVCLNVTPLLTQFVPFNLSSPDVARNGIRCKWYGNKLALRTNLNVILNEDEINDFYLSIGYERRRPIYKKISYTTGWDFFVWSFPTTNRPFQDQTTLVGPAKFYGIEYNISPRIFVATEAQVLIGLGNGVQIKTNTPTNVMLGVRI